MDWNQQVVGTVALLNFIVSLRAYPNAVVIISAFIREEINADFLRHSRSNNSSLLISKLEIWCCRLHDQHTFWEGADICYTQNLGRDAPLVISSKMYDARPTLKE